MTDKRNKFAGGEGADPNRYAELLRQQDEGLYPTPTPKVGYGSPPIKTRFRPGKSGNPQGRPKGCKNLRTAITNILMEKMTVRIRDKNRRVTSFEAVFMTMLNKALKGDQKAIQFVYTNAKAWGLLDHVPQKVVLGDDLSHFTTDELEEFERLLIKGGARILPE